MEEVRPESGNISKAEQGCTETRESLTSPHEKPATWMSREEKESGFVMDNIAFITRGKKRAISQAVTEPGETEGKVKDEGSFSIPIVPIESWEIQPGKAK